MNTALQPSAVRKTMAIYVITRHGLAHARVLQHAFPQADLYVSKRLLDEAPTSALPLPLPMGPALADNFTTYDCQVFIISIGAVVRMIAPLLRDKKTDPAVVCVDDAARFSICVLSGHVGRGNEFAGQVAAALDAQAVITTASDAIGTLTVDILGRDLGWILDDMDRNVTRGCAAVVNARPVLFVQETGEPNFWPLDKSLPPGVVYTTALDDVDPDAWEILLIATDRDLKTTHPQHWQNSVIYRPKSLCLGLGCDRDTPPALVERGVQACLDKHGLSSKSVRAIATIDKKRAEAALLSLSAAHNWPMEVYPAAELDVVPGIENPSEVVKKYVGTRAVAEPAALLAAGAQQLLVPKQVYKEPDVNRSMTMAVARIPFAQRGRGGCHG